jgi:hypothetical protein
MFGLGLMTIGIALIIIAFGYLFFKVAFVALHVFGLCLYSFADYIYNNIFVKHDLEKDGYLEKEKERRRLTKEIEQAKIDKRHNEQTKEQNDKVIYATLQKVRELKAKYPLADESLFNEYMDSFNTRPLRVCQEIADLIKVQHIARLEEKEEHDYQLEDVLLMDKLEEKSQDDIVVTMYQEKNDYIVLIQNVATNVKLLHTTKNIVLAKKIMENTLQKQKIKKINDDAQVKDSLNKEEMNDIVQGAIAQINQYWEATEKKQ